MGLMAGAFVGVITVGLGVAAGVAAGVFRKATALATSSLRTRPPGPEPGIDSAVSLLSSAILLAAGITRTSLAGGLLLAVGLLVGAVGWLAAGALGAWVGLVLAVLAAG